MTVIKKIKGISNKIEGNKAQNDLDWQTVKILISSSDVTKYDFFYWKRCCTRKILAKKN